MSDSGRSIACPHCATGYFLPAGLIGDAGARVRCPRCGRTFVVEPGTGGDGGEGPVGGTEAARARSGAVPRAQDEAASRVSAPVPAPDPSAVSPRGANAGPEPGGPSRHPANPGEDAVAALDALEARLGESLARAVAEGRLFAAHGREIMDAFDAFRHAAGCDADSAAFRAALRERWGVELE
jgi:predicted Zn finger-like uncharacterized protein